MAPQTENKSFRLPLVTVRQLAELAEATGATLTQVLIVAIDRMHRETIAKK
jgi:hypothetical protein